MLSRISLVVVVLTFSSSLMASKWSKISISQKGSYVGKDNSGIPCSMEVNEIKFSLLGSIKNLSVEITQENQTVAGIQLKCTKHIENGTHCNGDSPIFGHISLQPHGGIGTMQDGTRYNIYPHVLIERLGSCNDLQLKQDQ